MSLANFEAFNPLSGRGTLTVGSYILLYTFPRIAAQVNWKENQNYVFVFLKVSQKYRLRLLLAKLRNERL